MREGANLCCHPSLEELKCATTAPLPQQLFPVSNCATFQMYCYPYPQASDIAPLRVPYVATVTYSLAGAYSFFSFLNESDCVQVLRGVRGTPASGSRLDAGRHALASTIQSWLFFGLATETLGRDISHDEFVEGSAPGGSDGWIDVRIPNWFWHELRARWTALKNTLSEHEFNEKQRRARECVTATKKMVDILDAMLYRPGLDLELGPVLLSVPCFSTSSPPSSPTLKLPCRT